jgi:tetratricopeptide (TPR) repeat protein
MDEQKQNVLNSYSHFFLSRTRELSSKFIELSEIYENSANAANIALENRKWEEYKDFVLNIAIFERYLYTRGFWVDALKYLRKGLNVANELDDKPTLAILEWNIGTLQREMGNYDEAIDSFDLAMKISIDLKDDYGLASALMGKGYVLLYSADYKNGGVVFQAAVQNSISSKNKMALGEALRGLGRISISLGEINRALEYLYQSEPILREMNNYQGLSYNFRALGEAYGILSKTDTKYISLSFDCFEKGLKIAEQIGDPQAQAYIIRGQGDVYTLHGSIEKAIECYKKSELLFISVGDRASLAATLCSIGEAYLDIQELDLANTYCSQAKGLAFTMSLPRWQGRSLFLQAKIQFEMGSNQEALELARRAKKLLKKIGHRDEQLVNQWIKKILDEKKE